MAMTKRIGAVLLFDPEPYYTGNGEMDTEDTAAEDTLGESKRPRVEPDLPRREP
jgi:hypothetical protein